VNWVPDHFSTFPARFQGRWIFDILLLTPFLIRTRIPVWLLESLRRLGATDSTLLAAYPTINAEDLANAWAYARAHRDEMDREIAENGDAA